MIRGVEYQLLGLRPIPGPVAVCKFPGLLGQYLRREHVNPRNLLRGEVDLAYMSPRGDFWSFQDPGDARTARGQLVWQNLTWAADGLPRELASRHLAEFPCNEKSRVVIPV